MAGDPALEVDERAATEGALFGQRLVRAAQPLTAFALDCVRERRKEAEIDVHWLVRARAGGSGAGGGFPMAAGGVGGQCAMRRGRRRGGGGMGQAVGGWKPGGGEPNCGGVPLS